MTENYIGVDVAKGWIDVFDPQAGTQHINMEVSELRGFARALKKRDCLVILEATGGYENPLIAALEQQGIAYHRANPARARNFARAIGVIGKSDKVDAKCLALMGKQLDLKATLPPCQLLSD